MNPPEDEYPEDLTDETLPSDGVAHYRPPTSDAPIARIIGRYEIRHRLGKGAFGEVFLALDPSLQRAVAIKVFAASQDPSRKQHLLEEVRTLAQMDHPGIVPVHDFGEDEGRVYFVAKFIEGESLRRFLQHGNIPFKKAAEIIATIAEALDYAHSRSIVHRDIKPENIILDHEGTPVLIDFGVSLNRYGVPAQNSATVVGTPRYMSPEQARGESHLVDGRSDIYSLGVIFYELLTHQRPFDGEATSMFEQITSLTVEACPPRQISSDIPREFERICLRALAKAPSARHSTARDLANELRAAVAEITAREHHPESDPAGELPTVIPRGLRSFDCDDAAFFLRLLPGLVDPQGVPQSIRFWQRAIEDDVQPFRVGLLYGPSGSGKSSFLKAGLLPLLSDSVKVIYLAANSGDTQGALLNRLRSILPDLPAHARLSDGIATIREAGLPSGEKKLLIVIDQFEQWLHHYGRAADSELVSALRQCDGKNVQVLLGLRDDFWMAISQLMEDIGVELRPASNTSAIDLFDVDHARKVLIDFGTALHCLPAGTEAYQLPEANERFVTEAISEMASEGKVIPIQLSLFAEMSRNIEWTAESFSRLGGVDAVGAAFLDSVFTDRSANPAHRAVEPMARAILKALLPATGSAIRGRPQTVDELFEQTREEGDQQKFKATIRILDEDLKLITPADASRTAHAGKAPADMYQLTHDFLVETLRHWLNRKERESRRGRARLRLAARTELWTARPEAKQLPSLREWTTIAMLTQRKRRSNAERRLMAAAGKHHRKRIFLTSLVLLTATLFALSWWQSQDKRRADDLVADLWQAREEYLPVLLGKLKQQSGDWQTRVRQAVEHPGATTRTRVRGRLALSTDDPANAAALRELLFRANAEEQHLIREALRPEQAGVIKDAESVLRDDSIDSLQIIRSAAVLADFAPESTLWSTLAPRTVRALISQNPLAVNTWADALLPAAHHLASPALEAATNQSSALASEAALAASLAVKFNAAAPQKIPDQEFADRALNCSRETCRILMPAINRRSAALSEIFRRVASQPVPIAPTAENDRQLIRQSNAVEILFALGDDGPLWRHLANTTDPRQRTLLINALPAMIPDSNALSARLNEQESAAARQAIMIALAEHHHPALPADQPAAEILRQLSTGDPDTGVRLSAAWALAKMRGEPRDHGIRGLTMIAIKKPGTFAMIQLEEEPGRDAKPNPDYASIDYGFEIGATEITLGEFHRFRPDFVPSEDVTRSEDAPVTRVTLFDAMQFCRWLNEQDPAIDADRGCYPPIDKIKPGMPLHDGFQLCPGYRLPTTPEWEYACRAGAITTWSFGNSSGQSNRFCWSAANSNELVWPVASLRPNGFGLFDAHGNVYEWCHYPKNGIGEHSAIRGGSYRSTPKFLRIAVNNTGQSDVGNSINGFRVVKISPPATANPKPVPPR